MSPEDMSALEAACFPHSTTWSADGFREHAQKPDAILVTDANGFISGRVTADEAEIITVAVAPNARHKGIATRMIEQFEAQATRLGATTIFLEVADNNTNAQTLYARAGFNHAGTRKKYYRWPDGSTNDALILKKNL